MPPAQGRFEADLRATLSAYTRLGSNTAVASEMGLDESTVRRRMARAEQLRLSEREEPPPVVEVPAKPRIRVQAGKPGGTKLRVLAVGDTHFSPHVAPDRGYWIGRLARDEAVDAIEQIGDLGDFESLCKHVPDDTFAGRLKGTFLEDVAAVNAGLEKIAEGLGNHACKKHVSLGNHDDRIWSAADRAPHTWGLMEHEFTSMLDRHGWTYTRFGEMHYLGGVGFTHVPLGIMGRPYGGKNSENSVANDAVHDIVYGHTHRYQVRRAPKIGPFRHVTIVNLGCALPYGFVENYAKHSLTGWSWGTVLLTIQGGQITETKFVSMSELEERYA